MSTKLFLASLIVVLCVASPGCAQDEQEAVRKPLQAYLRAHATGKGEFIRQSFSAYARIMFVRDGKYAQLTRDEFASRFKGEPEPDEAQRRRWIDSVEITGNAAMAKIVLDYPKVSLTDYMQLLKIDGEWKIVNKIFNAQPKS